MSKIVTDGHCLKIKIKSLESEAKHIRHLIGKWDRDNMKRARRLARKTSLHNEVVARETNTNYKNLDKLTWSRALQLNNHRTGIVRFEARHTNLAYACLRGMPYSRVEPTSKVEPDWDKVRKMAERYCYHDGGYINNSFSQTRDKAEQAVQRWIEDAQKHWAAQDARVTVEV